jgi:hypothetical protein
LNSHRSQQPPRHLLFTQFFPVRRHQLRRRATGRGWRHRVRPPLDTPPVPGGGVELLPPFCVIADDPCFLSVTPSPSNTRPCKRR